MSDRDEVVFLGTGTSYGVPMIGCDCAVCRSSDPRNQRLRCSSLLRVAGRQLLIDVTPDFRTQALRAGITSLDAVIITHVHADHVFGLDDLRPLSLNRSSPLPVYATRASGELLRTTFEYVFSSTARRPGIPWLELREVVPFRAFEAAGLTIVTGEVEHGRARTLAIRCGDFAYLTDAKTIPEDTLELLQGVRVIALDMLREEPHATHLCLAESLDLVEKLGHPRTWFIHMGHEVDHGSLEARLPEHVRIAYDELSVHMAAERAAGPGA